MAFDQAGNVVHSWGGQSLHPDWPDRTTASSSTTRASSGSAATASPTRTSSSSRAKASSSQMFGKPKRAHDGRQTGRQQQRPGELRPRREDLHRPEGQRGVRRRRLLQQARRRHRHGHRQDQAVLGRVRQQAGRRAARPLRSEGAARRSSSARRCTAPSSRPTASSMCATVRTIAFRCSRRKASS